MDGETILFSWGLFAQNASTSMTNMWQDRYYTDVTLVTMDEKQIKAHKLILSSSSNFFKNIFVRNPHPNPLIYLKDINHKELELVLKFMYHGKCNVERLDIENFLQTGSQLGVSGLVKEEIIGNTQVTQPFTSSKRNKAKDLDNQRHLLENGVHENNDFLEQSDTSKINNDFEHPLESTVHINYTKKAGFEMEKV